MHAGNRIVASTAVRFPLIYMPAAVAQPAAFAKNAARRTTEASPGSPKIPMTGASNFPISGIIPDRFKKVISVYAMTIAGAISSTVM